MAFSALGKDTARTDYSALRPDITNSTPASTRELTSYEREALDHMPHASTSMIIPIYSLVRLPAAAIEDITRAVNQREYEEDSGMQFKIINWKKEGDGDDTDMLRTAMRKRKGLLVFLDGSSASERSVRMCDYEIWDDGWGEEDMAKDGQKGEGLKWGRIMFPDLLRVYTDVEVGIGTLEKFIVGGPKAIRVTRWGRLEQF